MGLRDNVLATGQTPRLVKLRKRIRSSMTARDFNDFWVSIYPDTVPIPYTLKHRYPNRWFRIHSLPESKRYAETQEEWTILLDRQNEIITDVLGHSSKVLLVTNRYCWAGDNKIEEEADTQGFARFNSTPLDAIDLHQLYPDDYDEGQTILPAFSEQVWQPRIYDELLKVIAQDEARAFFVSKINECLVAPYDGGIDFVLRDEATKNKYRHKYMNWLSTRTDGL